MTSTKLRPMRLARNREAGGAVRFDVIVVEVYLFDLSASADWESQYEQRLLDGVTQLLFEWKHVSERMNCFCCDKPVDVVVACVLVAANCDDVTEQIGGIICVSCDGSREDITQRAIAVWRLSTNPRVRKLKIYPSSGHA